MQPDENEVEVTGNINGMDIEMDDDYVCEHHANLEIEVSEQHWFELETDRARVLYEAMIHTLPYLGMPGESEHESFETGNKIAPEVQQKIELFAEAAYTALTRFSESLCKDC